MAKSFCHLSCATVAGARRLSAGGALLLALAASATAQTRYLAFGDSITNGVGFDDCDCQCPEECGYPPRLERLLQDDGFDAEVENHGVGGERTPEGLTRIDAVLAGGGDVLLLMEGSNDISRGISLETTLFNLAEMARKASQRGLSTVHATLIPRIPTAPVDAESFLTQRVGFGVRELAFAQGRLLADPFEVFGSTPDLFTRLYTARASDPVGHPNPDGYQLLAQIFFDILTGADRVLPVPGLVAPPNGRRGISPNAQIRLRLYDFGGGIDLGATELLVDGRTVPAALFGNQDVLDLSYQPPTPLSGRVAVGYRSRDLAQPPNAGERIVSEFTIEGSGRFAPGDIDGDGRVDGSDLVLLALHFGAVRGDPRYDADADLDGDGVIDGQDLALLAADFGASA